MPQTQSSVPPPAATAEGPVAKGWEVREQLRLAVVLNGGVSLAVWMGGATHEIDRLTRRDGAYARLLDWAMAQARVDVVSGTSAGGINGAALALSQCNLRSRGMGLLRDVWVDSGDFSRLLRQPFAGSPPSLLKGDEFFLPQLNQAMRRLAAPYEPKPVDDAPMDLTITATLLRGIPGVSIDDTGAAIAQTRHDALFRFQRGPTHRISDEADDFAREYVVGDGELRTTIDRLALAARTTASYPVAFEPSFLPTTAESARAAGNPMRPDMGPIVSGAWDESQAGPCSRYAIDGGLLANTPTRPALDAIDAMPAEGLVRRVLLLVHPHAPAAAADAHEKHDEPPTLLSLSSSLLRTLTSEGSRNYVDHIEKHNRQSSARQQRRADVVSLETAAREQQANIAYAWYRTLRLDRAARDLAQIWVTRAVPAVPHRAPEAMHEPFARVHRQIVERLDTGDFLPLPDGSLPDAHLLGFEGALGIADVAVDYLKRAMWSLATSGGPTEAVEEQRRHVSLARTRILNLRRAVYRQARQGAAGRPSDELDAWTQWVVGRCASTAVRSSLLAEVRAVAPATVQVPVSELGRGAEAAGARGFADAIAPAGAATTERVLQRLNAISVMTYVLADEQTTGGSLPIDLVQLTYGVDHPFAPGVVGEAKVAGDGLARFSAFLKQSWRVNDWAWGRLDASRVLCRTVLEPSRVRRYVSARQNVEDAESFAAAAKHLVDGLYSDGVLGSLPGAPSQDDVLAEVQALEAAAGPAGEPAALRHLPGAFACLLALEVAADEMPALVRAVEADKAGGANRRSRGTVTVTGAADLLTGAASASPAGCWQALEVFGRAGIGSEPLAQEASSDQMISTAAAAAATAVTVLDSPRSGLSGLKPVTRTLRGAALLPYWLVHGLTSGSRIASGLALLALSVGGVAFALGMLGLGPAGLVPIGAGAVLAAFAYAALRSGTVLHGVVLLVPGVALLVWASSQVGAGQAADESPGAAPAALLAAVALLVAGLIVLGSLTPPLASPAATLTTPAWRTRIGVMAVVLGVLTVLALPDVRRLIRDGWVVPAGVVETAIGSWTQWLARFGALLGLLLLVAGGVYAWWAGRQWRLLVLQTDHDEPGRWTRRRVESPAGVTAGWSWVYGFVLLAVSVPVLAWYGLRWPADPWAQALLLSALSGAVVLCSVVPVVVDRRAARALESQARAAFATAHRPPNGADPEESGAVQALFDAGLNYQRLLRDQAVASEQGATLRDLGLSRSARTIWAQSRSGATRRPWTVRS